MQYTVERQGSGISIRIDDVKGREQAVVERIRQCRQTAWACPSAECANIGSMQERIGEGSVQLFLTPRPGATLEPTGVEQCLRYMLSQAGGT